MTQISFKVPDVQVSFMMELLKNLEFVDSPSLLKDKYVFTDEQIKLVEIERKKAKENSDYLLDLDEVINKIIVE